MSTKNWADEDQSSDDGSVDMRDNHAATGVDETDVQGRETRQNHSSVPHEREDSIRQHSRRDPVEIPTRGPFMAFVGNLPFSMNENDIGIFFQDGGCNVKDVVLKLDDGGRPRGMARVEFHDRKSLERALEANNHRIEGRSIRVDVDSRRPKPFGHGNVALGGSKYEESGRMKAMHGRGGRDRTFGHSENKATRPPRRDRDLPSPPGHPEGSKPAGENPEIDVSKVSITENSTAQPPPPPPATRPKINIQPRTLPVDTIGQPIATNEKIFGGGKPHDDKTYEEVKKKKEDKGKSYSETSDQCNQSGTTAGMVASNSMDHSSGVHDREVVPDTKPHSNSSAIDERPAASTKKEERHGDHRNERGAERGGRSGRGRGGGRFASETDGNRTGRGAAAAATARAPVPGAGRGRGARGSSAAISETRDNNPSAKPRVGNKSRIGDGADSEKKTTTSKMQPEIKAPTSSATDTANKMKTISTPSGIEQRNTYASLLANSDDESDTEG